MLNYEICTIIDYEICFIILYHIITEEDQILNGATLHVAYPILSIPCLLMPWRLKEPRHRQAWYWPNKPECSVSSIRRVKILQVWVFCNHKTTHPPGHYLWCRNKLAGRVSPPTFSEVTSQIVDRYPSKSTLFFARKYSRVDMIVPKGTHCDVTQYCVDFRH